MAILLYFRHRLWLFYCISVIGYGYFIAFSTSKPIASKVVSLCEEIGVLITPAGSTFPNGNDPNNSIIRIAPTFVSEKELTDAMEAFITCVELAHFDISI